MSFTKKEAIFYLAHQMGSVDGEFSDEEQNHLVVLSSYYRDNLNSMDSELLLSGIRNGTLNENSACYILKDLELNEKVEIFAALFIIIAADGEASEEESDLLTKYLDLVELDFEPVIERWKEILNN